MSIYGIVSLVRRYPALGYGVGVIAIGGATFLGINLRSEALAQADGPVAARISELPPLLPKPGRFVELRDVTWDCAQAVHDTERNSVYVIGSDVGQTRYVVVRFDDTTSCEAATTRPMTGLVNDIWPAFRDRLETLGVALPTPADGSSQLEMCTSCTSSNRTIGYLVTGGFALLGLALFPMTFVYARRRRAEDEDESEGTRLKKMRGEPTPVVLHDGPGNRR